MNDASCFKKVESKLEGMGKYQSIYAGAYVECKMIRREEKVLKGKKCPASHDAGTTRHRSVEPEILDESFDFCPKCGIKLEEVHETVVEFSGKHSSKWDLMDEFNDRLIFLHYPGREDIIIFYPNRTMDTGTYIDSGSGVNSVTEIADVSLLRNIFESEFEKELECLKKNYDAASVKSGVLVSWD
jgi:hypothetical protein